MTEPETSRAQAYSTPRPDVAALLPPTATSILDLGCGTGAFGAALVATGRRVIGIEHDAAAATQAATVLDRVHHLDLSSAGWLDVLGDDRFDAIVAADVLEHLPHPESVLRAAAQRLTPDGVMLVSLPNIRHISALGELVVRGRFPRRERGIFDDTHLRWFTWREVLALHATAGLTIETWSANLRLVDRPGAPVNDRVERTLGRWRHRGPIREFLAYQFVVRSHRSPFGG